MFNLTVLVHFWDDASKEKPFLQILHLPYKAAFWVFV